MSWLELDDGILEHPKFIRAVKLGGSEAVHLWLGLRAYCGQHLTDGAIPRDMLYEVRGPSNPKKRAAALAVLFSVGLLEDDGATNVQMHDFLDWSSSRDAVLAARERARERKARSRGSHGVTDAVTPLAVTPVVTPVVTHPSPLLSSSTPTPTPNPKSESAPTRADEQATWDGSERETACPLDLCTRAKALKIPEQLAERLKVDVEAVEASLREFVGYWTIGEGMGMKRRYWMRKAREHVRRSAGRLGGLQAPGALERHKHLEDNAAYDAREALSASRRVRDLLALADNGVSHG